MATVLYWELEQLPQGWKDAFRMIDVPFAPSRIVQRALHDARGTSVPYIPVVPSDIDVRPKHREPDQPFTFFTNFDTMSAVNRKNPHAALSAFLEAFGDRRDVRLVVKIWESPTMPINRELLRATEQEHPSIVHIVDDLSYQEMRQLIVSVALTPSCVAHLILG